LAKTLVESKHEIAIIEKDKDLSQEISREMDVLVINGDGTQIKTLEGVNANSADAFVASTRKDETNLLSALVAKNMGVKTVISRVSNPENKEVFKKLGIDHVISPEITAAEYISKIIRRPDAVDLAILGRRDVEILEFVVDNKSEVTDMAVKDLTPKGYLIIAVHKGSELVIPKGDTVIEEGDEVLVLSKSNSVGNVEKLFVVKNNEKKD
jgi:trk system potassium uptake protein TrkA